MFPGIQCSPAHPQPHWISPPLYHLQLILPQKQVGRRSDIYVFCCSYSHHVAPKDKWLAFVSTTVETTDPTAELAAGAFP